LSDAVS